MNNSPTYRLLAESLAGKMAKVINPKYCSNPHNLELCIKAALNEVPQLETLIELAHNSGLERGARVWNHSGLSKRVRNLDISISKLKKEWDDYIV
jgi:hypothetical protein